MNFGNWILKVLENETDVKLLTFFNLVIVAYGLNKERKREKAKSNKNLIGFDLVFWFSQVTIVKKTYETPN